MRAKKLFAILMVVLTVISATMVLLPLGEFELARNSMSSNPMSSGSFYTYTISVDRNSYANVIGNTNNYTFPTGVIKLTVLASNVNIREKIFNSQLSRNYCVNIVCPANSSIVQFFLNDAPIYGGSFYQLPEGLVGTAVKDTHNYRVIYETNNTSLANLETRMGVTCPEEILVNNVNESLVPSSDRYYLSVNRNQFDYDHAGNTNILVRSFITGNTSFLNQIFRSSGLQYSVYFSLFLVATNIGLHPIDYAHYLSEYALYIPPIWIISLLVLYSLIRSARKRTGK